MDQELQQIISRLDKLVLQRSEITSKLASVDAKIALAIKERNRKQKEPSTKKKSAKAKRVLTDSPGEGLVIGDTIETVTRGKYFERKGEVININ